MQINKLINKQIKKLKLMVKISEILGKLTEEKKMNSDKLTIAEDLVKKDQAIITKARINRIELRHNDETNTEYFNICFNEQILGRVPNGVDSLGNPIFDFGYTNYANFSVVDLVIALSNKPEMAIFADRNYLTDTIELKNGLLKVLNANLLLNGGEITLAQEVVRAGEVYNNDFNGGQAEIKKDGVINHIIDIKPGATGKKLINSLQ